MARCLFEAKREDLLSHPYLLRQTKDSQTRIQCMLASNRVSGTNDNGTICSISSQWLLALPNPGLSQYMTPSEFRAAIAMRLAIPLFATSMPCPKSACQSNHVMMDKFGYHILACRGDRNMCKARHDLVRDALSDLAGKCDFNPVKDAPVNCLGFSSNGVLHRYRPADLLIRGNDFNRDCIDVTVVSPISKIMGPSDNFRPGNKANKAEIAKINKHLPHCEAAGYGFHPFAVDIFGMLGLESAALLRRICYSYHACVGIQKSLAHAICLRRVSFSIQLGIARQLVSFMDTNSCC